MYIAKDLAGSGDFGLYARSEQLSMAHAAFGTLESELQCRRMLYSRSKIFACNIACSKSISGSSVVGWLVGCGDCGIDRCGG